MSVKRNRIAALVTLAVGSLGLIGIEAASGCGGDDSGAPTNEAGPEMDQSTGTDAVPDSPLTTDAGEVADAGPEGGGGGGMDASDGGNSLDAAELPDVVPITAFPHAVDEAYCQRLQQCCLLQPSQWNQEGSGGCVPLLDSVGGVFNNGGFSAALDSGLVTYDRQAAAICLQELSNLACGQIAANAITKVQSDCFAPLKGTLGVDAGPCVNALECATGEFCEIGADAGTGFCKSLKTTGQACSDTVGSLDCSYRGLAPGSSYCGPSDGGSACLPTLPIDAGCQSGQQCQSGSCKYPTCVDSVLFSDPGVPHGECTVWTIVDAGSDAADGG
jgi:hypothetical protein